MKWWLLTVCVVWMGCADTTHETPYVQKGEIQLTPPTLFTGDVFFADSAALRGLTHPKAGTTLSCAFAPLDGSALVPLNVGAPIRSNGCVMCHALHPDFLPSDPARADYRQTSSLSHNAESYGTPPAQAYFADGYQTLFDGRKATTNFREGWLGFDQPVVTLNLEWPEDCVVEQIALSTLVNHDAWIFEPKSVRVFATGELLGQASIAPPEESTKEGFRFYDFPLRRTETNTLTIQIETCNSLPDWHPGAGNQGWLFLDEILLN